MRCKVTKGLINADCTYAVAGVQAVYLANFYTPVVGDAATDNAIAYEYDADGYISGIHLPTGELFFPISGESETMSFTDNLVAGGNGGKYRQHSLNAVINQYDIDLLNEADALSLGRFIAVVVDTAGRIIVLGRTGGLAAPADGFNYASGAAAADATGWTLLLQGVSKEVAPIVKDITVITPIYQETITP